VTVAMLRCAASSGFGRSSLTENTDMRTRSDGLQGGSANSDHLIFKRYSEEWQMQATGRISGKIDRLVAHAFRHEPIAVM
jgi:hypothetical protein